MEPAHGPRNAQELSQNGAQWLKACMHSSCCSRPSNCGLPQCQAVRSVLKHIHSCPPSNPDRLAPACTPLRQLAAHWLGCQDSACELCAGVSRDLSEQVAPPVTPPITDLGKSSVPRKPAAEATDDDADSEEKLPDSCTTSSGEEDEKVNDDVEDGHVAESDMAGLIMFAQYLQHSFLRWKGADAAPAEGARPNLPAPLLDADDLECLQRGRDLWTHILRDCSRITAVCGHPGCMQARRVLLHMLRCEDATCELCGPVKLHFAGGPPPPLLRAVHRKSEDMEAWMQDLEGSLQLLAL